MTTITLDIGPNTQHWRIQEFHKCIPDALAATKLLDPAQYSFNLLSKVSKIPELLFQKCKEWASNATGMLYLIARRFESGDEYSKVQIPENYKEIPWLNKVLVESKIKLNDDELYEFLRLVKDKTAGLFAFKGGGPTEKLVYKIGLSTVPTPSE